MADRDGVVYFDGDEAKTLTSGAKVEVMEELERGEKGFGDLVDSLGRAKSTVSSHLNDLERMGLVEMEASEEDARRRIVRTVARRIGSTCQKRDLEAPLEELVASSVGSREDFLKSLIVVLRYFGFTEGLDLSPEIKDAGRLVGRQVGERLEGESLPDASESLSDFWGDAGLGEMAYNEPHLVLKNSSGCEDLPGPGICGFFEGLMEGALSGALDRDFFVEMEKCEAIGSKYCSFRVGQERAER